MWTGQSKLDKDKPNEDGEKLTKRVVNKVWFHVVACVIACNGLLAYKIVYGYNKYQDGMMMCRQRVAWSNTT